METTTPRSKIATLPCPNFDKIHTTNQQSQSCQALAVITVVTTAGHRPVSPTRCPQTCQEAPEAGTQWSRSALMSNQSGQGKWERKNFHNHLSSHPFRHSSNTHTGKTKCKPSLIPLFFPPLLLVFFSLVCSSLSFGGPAVWWAWGAAVKTVQVQNELMFVINKSAKEKPQRRSSQEYRCHPTQLWAQHWRLYS